MKLSTAINTLTLVLLGGIFSCSIFSSKPIEPLPDQKYQVKFKASNWKSSEKHGTDFVFTNENTGDVLIAKSLCSEYLSNDLDIMATKAFDSLKSYQLISKAKTRFRKHHSVELYATAKIDGQKVEIFLKNLKIKNCYYDFVHIKSPRSQRDKSFEHFLDSVSFND